VARVTGDTAARLIDGQRAGDFQVRISVGNPRGRRVPRKPLSPWISTWDLSTSCHAFLPDDEEDGASKAPCGAPHPLGC
jgi:hypothetical protein